MTNTTLMSTYARLPVRFERGAGANLWDSDGKEYLDALAGVAVCGLGHAHPAVTEALCAQAARLVHTSNIYRIPLQEDLSAELAKITGMDRAFFCNSGAEAVEASLKLARRARPGRPCLVVFERSFHGRTLGALSATAQPHYQEAFRPLVPGFVTVPFGDFDAAATAIDEHTAAVLVEPLQGEGGVRPSPPGWLAHLRARCDAVGALLMLDEVQTGIGRTGPFYAFQDEEIVPDVVVTAKALAGGLPMGALLARGEAALAFRPGDHASTFGGGPLVAAVANAVLDVVLGAGFLDGVRFRGERLARGLRRIAAGRPTAREVRGAGLMQGLVLEGEHAPAVVDALRERGVLALSAGRDVVRFVPPLVIAEAEIDEALDALAGALDAVAAGPVEARS